MIYDEVQGKQKQKAELQVLETNEKMFGIFFAMWQCGKEGPTNIINFQNLPHIILTWKLFYRALVK